MNPDRSMPNMDAQLPALAEFCGSKALPTFARSSTNAENSRRAGDFNNRAGPAFAMSTGGTEASRRMRPSAGKVKPTRAWAREEADSPGCAVFEAGVLEPHRDTDLRGSERPKSAVSAADAGEPIRARLRMEVAEPVSVLSIGGSENTEPRRAKPKVGVNRPGRVCCLTGDAEPISL